MPLLNIILNLNNYLTEYTLTNYVINYPSCSKYVNHQYFFNLCLI